MNEPKCEHGCKIFKGGEIRHIKECIFYPDSLSELLDDNKSEIASLLAEVERLKQALPSESRCCGRCDGVHDICVADMICDKHSIEGCELCYGSRGNTLILETMEEFKLPDGNDTRKQIQENMKRVGLKGKYLDGQSQGFADCYNWIHSLIQEHNKQLKK